MATPLALPSIFVVSLADFNDGTIHGAWIDAVQSIERLQDEVAEMLATSPRIAAEEWTILDAEGFGAFQVEATTDLAVVAEVARGVNRFGPDFGHWASYCSQLGSLDELDQFEDRFVGCWQSIRQYAESFVQSNAPEWPLYLDPWLRSAVRLDYEKLGRQLTSDYVVIEQADSVLLFAG